MRGGLEVGEGDGCVLEDCAGPCFAKLGGYFGLQAAELGEDVVVVCVLVAGFDPDLLACAEGVVACVSLLDGLLEEGGGVCVDDYCGPCFEVVDGLMDFHWVVVEGCGIHRYKAQVIPRLPSRYHILRRLGYHGTDQWRDTRVWRLGSIKVYDEDIQRGEILLDSE